MLMNDRVIITHLGRSSLGNVIAIQTEFYFCEGKVAQSYIEKDYLDGVGLPRDGFRITGERPVSFTMDFV